MDLFKLKKFRKSHKPSLENEGEDKPVPPPEDPNSGSADGINKSVSADTNSNNEAEDDDDDFITNEVKRRLKELRRNSFMVLIPEESSPGDEEEDEDDEEEREPGSNEWRDVEAEGRQFWSGFDAIYDLYCERMLVCDRSIVQQLREIGSHVPSAPSPRSASKKLASPFRCLSIKRIEEPADETEHLQHPGSDPHQDLETAYVAQMCLTWDALHCQYTLLSQKISCQPEDPTCYNHCAQEFQQFQVLLQRFIENEPFEQGPRHEVYANKRILLPKLLQVPKVQGTGSDQKRTEEESSELLVLAPDLIRIIENSILTFRLFLKMDKKKGGGVRNLFGTQNQIATPLHQIQSCLEKKEIKMKEQRKKAKNWKKKSWPSRKEEIELLLGLIDVKVCSRVLRTVGINREQLFWCEEKMKKLYLSEGKLLRDPAPVLFPC